MGLYKGEQLIAGVAGGLSNIDNITITENANEEIQTVAVKNQNATANNAIKTWTGTQAQYDAITTKDPTTLYNVTDTDPSYSVNTQYKNIGAIVQSVVPLTDAGLHLLDGSLIQMGVYSEFVEYIADLYAENPSANYWTTEALWQQSVTTYGVCGKFVYDSVNNTVRLPKITGIIEGTTDATALGDLVEAGLPNITATGGSRVATVDGAFYIGNYNNMAGGTWTTSNDSLCFDASRSSSIYGNSQTVQPQTIKAFYYIVIANSTKTDIQVDIDEVVTDLNGKADTDLTNVTDTGYIKMAGASMPSGTYTDLTLGASGSSYTAPADGWFALFGYNGGSNYYVEMKANNVIFTARSGYGGNDIGLSCPVVKGSSMTLRYDGFNSVSYFRFIYAKGSESEAS